MRGGWCWYTAMEKGREARKECCSRGGCLFCEGG